MLSIGAFNALLKTLEEPPEYIIFILATTEPQKLPATIISRCQRFDFKSISHDKMKDCLQNIINKENISIDDEALEGIISNSKGGMRDAIGLLDQSSAFSDDKVTVKDIEELSGNISNTEVCSLISNIVDKNYKVVFEKISDYSSIGKDFSLICEKLINYIRKGILYKKGLNSNDITENDKEIFDNMTDGKLYIMIDILSETLTKLVNNYQKELIFEVQLIQLIDKLSGSSNYFSNVSRETLEKKTESSTLINVSRETSIKTQKNISEVKKDNVPRETLENNIEISASNDVPRETYESNTNENEDLVEEIKKIRINNILKEATKQDMTFLVDLWSNINDYLIDEKYKIPAGILVNSKPVAASKTGIIITLPLESTVNRIEKEYDNSKELLKEIYNENYKIVYISEDYWKKERPIYVEKARNNQLEIIDETDALNKLKEMNNKNSVNEFNELIEMEEI